jgi:hypothetical protein
MTVVEVEFLPLLHHAIAKVIQYIVNQEISAQRLLLQLTAYFLHYLWQRQFIGG